MSAVDGEWHFEGDGANDFCTYAYQGYATPEKLKLFLNDVALKSGGVKPEIWQPAPIDKEPAGGYKSLPFYIEWKYDPIPNVDINLSPFVEALTTLPVIPVYGNTAYMSVSEALSLVLRTVAFRPDGNLIFTYVSTGFGAEQIAQTEPNRFQYAIDSPSTVRLYIDPMSLAGLILTNTSGGTPSSDVDLTDKGLFPASSGSASGNQQTYTEAEILRKEIMSAALSYFLPRLAEGIPMDFAIDGNGLKVFIDTKIAVDLFNNIIIPVLKEQKYVEAVEKYLASLPTLAPLLPQLQKALELIPIAFERTNTLRLGFSFEEYSGQ